MLKKITVLLLSVLLALTSAGFLFSCEKTGGQKKYSVVTTVYPEYDWVMNILGENAEDFEVTVLLDNGADLHSYQPSAKDIVKVSSCDLFVYVGGESDEWVGGALDSAGNDKITAINLLGTLGDKAKTEEAVEGMQHEHEGGEEHEEELDEHVWLSLGNAKIFVNAIAEAIGKIDAENSSVYAANAAAYNAKLHALDEKYRAAVSSAARDTILVADRFPFRYLVDDYNIKYFAAFAGCSAETEASVETIAFLVNKTDELELDVILETESGNGKIAATIKRDCNLENKANIEVLKLDSFQSATKNNTVSYLSVMESNLEILKKALA